MSKWTFKWMYDKWRKLLYKYYDKIQQFSNLNDYNMTAYTNDQNVLPFTYMLSVSYQNLIRGYGDPLNSNRSVLVIKNFTIQDGVFKGLNFYDVCKSSNQILVARVARYVGGTVSEYSDYCVGTTQNNQIFIQSSRSTGDFTYDGGTSVLIYFVPVNYIS